jgi:two-component system chemotaxis response regulator CheY
MGKSILIVDDESDIRFLLKRFFIANHYVVKEAENLKKGIQLFNDIHPDIVILDINLPDGSGIQHASHFKTEKSILILISADNDQLTQEFENYDANGFLRKPFTPNDLLCLIDKIQQKRSFSNSNF